jgi:hypothetical protein
MRAIQAHEAQPKPKTAAKARRCSLDTLSIILSRGGVFATK